MAGKDFWQRIRRAWSNSVRLAGVAEGDTHKGHAATVSFVARHQRVETTRRRRGGEPHHDPGIPPGLTRVNDPNHVAIGMNLGTGHDAFRKKPLGVMSFDKEGLFEIRLRRFTGLAN